MKNRMTHQSRSGMSLPEVMVAVAVLSIALVSMYQLSRQLSTLGRLSQLKASAISIVVSQIEIIRNLPYDSVASDATYPTGPLQSTQTITRNNVTFTVTTNINYIDDPADGKITGTIPIDTAPADYKLVEVAACWDSSTCSNPVKLSTYVAPKNLENTTNTGALFIYVVDANGDPVSQATVTVTNPSPAVTISNHTDNNGTLQLLNLPPAQDTYHITITKSGYSSSGTVPATVANPNPVHPDTTIVATSVTNATFVIDLVGQLTVQVADSQSCSALSGVQFRLHGTIQLLGRTPDIYTIDQNLTADTNGQIVVPNLPWDDYILTMITSNLDVAGVNPPDTITISPGASVTVALAAATHQAVTSRIIVRDSGTSHAPIANATVRLEDGAGYDQTQTTDQGTLQQTDWVGGGGQATIGLLNKYFSVSGGATGQQSGHLILERVNTPATMNENFANTNFRDDSSTTAVWAGGQVVLPPDPIIPGVYSASAVAQSIKLNAQLGLITDVTLTAVTSLNGQSIVFEVTADGTHFEPVTSGTSHTFIYPGSDLRWRATLTTSDTTLSPSVTSVDLAYDQLLMNDTQGTLVSSTFDNGQATNFLTLSWNASIPPSAGPGAVRWQVATNDDATTWTYVGPDGTAATYFTASGSSLPASLNNHRYLRYKLFLATADPLVTPDVTSVTLVKNNACTPPGQVFFSPLPSTGTYTITTTKAGYDTDIRTVNLTGNSVEYIDLSP